MAFSPLCTIQLQCPFLPTNSHPPTVQSSLQRHPSSSLYVLSISGTWFPTAPPVVSGIAWWTPKLSLSRGHSLPACQNIRVLAVDFSLSFIAIGNQPTSVFFCLPVVQTLTSDWGRGGSPIRRVWEPLSCILFFVFLLSMSVLFHNHPLHSALGAESKSFHEK